MNDDDYYQVHSSRFGWFVWEACSFGWSVGRSEGRVGWLVGSDQTFRKIKWKLKLVWETSFLEISAEIKLYSRTFPGTNSCVSNGGYLRMFCVQAVNKF